MRHLFLFFFIFSISNTSVAAVGGQCTDLAAEHIDRFDDVFGQFIKYMDVSPFIRERSAGGLKVFRISDVFNGKNEVFLGFGQPNLYLVVPDGKGGYRKFAAKSLKRAPAKYEDTRDFAQSGYLLRFKDLPEETVNNLRELIKKQEGKRHWTCVNANCQVLAGAGFTTGDQSLNERFFPYQLARRIIENGLQLEGKNVEFDVIRTSSLPLQAFTNNVMMAEASTPYRHGNRAFKPWFERFGISTVWAFAKNKPRQVALYLTGKRKSEQEIKHVEQLVKTLPGERQQYIADINLQFSRSSKLGFLMRLLWGTHALYEARKPSVNIDEYLPIVLKEFPQEKPNFVTRLKQNFLFSQPVISFIRSKLAKSFQDFGNVSEKTIYDQIAVHTEASPNMHNIVITGDRIVIARLHVRNKFIDWILTKHVLVSGYDPDVRFAGEIWKEADGTIVLNRNSGTYRPSEAALQKALAYLRAVFPKSNIRVQD